MLGPSLRLVACAMMQGMPTLASAIKTAREAARITQFDLGEQVGTRSQTASRWEREDTVPDARHLPGIIRVLEMDPESTWRLYGEAVARRDRARVAAVEALADAEDEQRKHTDSAERKDSGPEA